MIYLASPLSHHDEKVINWRRQAACKVAAHWLDRGYHVYSPIAHSALIYKHLNNKDTISFDTWRDFDLHMLGLAQELWVLTLPGWEDSYGVNEEIKYWSSMYKYSPYKKITHHNIIQEPMPT